MAEFQYKRVDYDEFAEGDMVYLQNKVTAKNISGIVILKLGWIFMLQGREEAFNTHYWYVALLEKVKD